MGLTLPGLTKDLLYQIRAAEVLCPRPTGHDGRSPSGATDDFWVALAQRPYLLMVEMNER